MLENLCRLKETKMRALSFLTNIVQHHVAACRTWASFASKSLFKPVPYCVVLQKMGGINFLLLPFFLATVSLVSFSCSGYGFKEIKDDAAYRHVYYNSGDCEEDAGFTATVPTDNTNYLRLDTPTLEAKPICSSGGAQKEFSYWQVTNSGNDGEHKPGDKIPFSRHSKYFNVTAVWQCLQEKYVSENSTSLEGSLDPVQCKTPGQSYNLSAGTNSGTYITKTGYYLAEWKDENGDSHNLSKSMTAPANANDPMPTFQSVWKPVNVTVNFNNGGKAFQAPAPLSVIKNYEESVAIPNASTAKTNYYTLKTPSGWKASGGAWVNAGSQTVASLWSYTNWTTNSNASTATLALTAQWTPKPVTVTYSTNGGSLSSTTGSGTYDQNFTLATPTRPKYTFDGWYKDSGLSTQITNPVLNESNFALTNTNGSPLKTTVYAKWKPILINNITINGNLPEYVEKNQTFTFKTSISPAVVADNKVKWSSTTSSICTVSPTTAVVYNTNVTVKVITSGNCKITVTASDSGSATKSYTKNIEVSEYKIADEMKSGSYSIPSGGLKFPTGDDDSHRHKIQTKFKIARYETTYALWRKIRDWATVGTCNSSTGQGCYSFASGGKGVLGDGSNQNSNSADGDEQPVSLISWRDAIVWCNAFTDWYNAVKGGSLIKYYGSYKSSTNVDVTNTTTNPSATGFRLPTALEWQFAARFQGATSNANSLKVGSYYYTKGKSASGATAQMIHPPTSDNATMAVAWSKGNSDNKTHPVGKKTPNQMGLYDMSGNIAEFVYDSHRGDNPQPVTTTSSVFTWGSSYLSTCMASATTFYSGATIGSTNSSANKANTYFIGFRVAQNE